MKKVPTWPLGYLSQALLLIGMVLAMGTMFFYPLGIVFLTMILSAGVTRLMKRSKPQTGSGAVRRGVAQNGLRWPGNELRSR